MNLPNLAAAALMTLLFFVHLFMGTPKVLDPIQASDLSLPLIAISSVIWHAISALLAIFAAALFVHARKENTALMLTISAVNIAVAALFLFYGATLMGNIFTPMPHWIFFLAVVGLNLWGFIRANAAR
ncbi:MAG: hypothetical protein CR993_04815 [Rhodobacterales bacterium]|nr:MAG: hypothetical protein CR993_04815 [Rhodobacterales bacterium]